MDKESIKVFDRVIDRMMEVIPEGLKPNVNTEHRLVLDSQGNQVTEPYMLSVCSGSADDRWMRFMFIERDNGDRLINQIMGSIDGGSTTIGSPYVISPKFIYESIDDFITLVFLPKMSSVFRDYTFMDNHVSDNLVDYAKDIFFQAVAESTKGSDVFVDRTWDKTHNRYKVSYLMIDFNDGTGKHKFFVRFERFSTMVSITFAEERVDVHHIDESPEIAVKKMVKTVINRCFCSGETDDE